MASAYGYGNLKRFSDEWDELHKNPKSDEIEWISASRALQMLKSLQLSIATRRICERANHGLIRARAERLQINEKQFEDRDIPRAFWWAHGEIALKQQWDSGDFSTWLDSKIQIFAYGVKFDRAAIEKILPVEAVKPEVVPLVAGGRPPAEWWDDLWVEICRQLYEGDLKPEKQADIEQAMLTWLTAKGHNANESTVRPRARKLWAAIKGKN
ncbi:MULTISPECIES: hypothetical protein [unclassified Bradyrhizobium]|uniref:hypothetical protein n=1 Tax=unclassified Bradyrhizobium TaxID=2631580 RepID=UPI0029170A53|nr:MULTISPECIES: hypothetical protein [unclassified Bradyrhizobium]